MPQLPKERERVIYVIAPEGSSVVKIGHTANKPTDRVGSLQTGNPERLVVRWAAEGDEALERHLHFVFKDYRIRGEWFDLSPLGDPVEAVKEETTKAMASLARGEALIVAERFRDTSFRRDWRPEDDLTNPSRIVRRAHSWDNRFPLPTGPASPQEEAEKAARAARKLAARPLPLPGCIRVWQGRCHRPKDTICGC